MPKTSRPASPLRKIFGANLRAARKQKDLSIFDVAYSIKMDWSYISQIERGQRNVGIDILDALAGAVGYRLVELLDEAQALQVEAENGIDASNDQ